MKFLIKAKIEKFYLDFLSKNRGSTKILGKDFCEEMIGKWSGKLNRIAEQLKKEKILKNWIFDDFWVNFWIIS